MATLLTLQEPDNCHGCGKKMKAGTTAVWSSRDGWVYHKQCAPERKENPKLTICPAGAAEGSNHYVPQVSHKEIAVDEHWSKTRRMAWM